MKDRQRFIADLSTDLKDVGVLPVSESANPWKQPTGPAPFVLLIEQCFRVAEEIAVDRFADLERKSDKRDRPSWRVVGDGVLSQR